MDKHSLIMLTYCIRPKVGIKLLKISHVRMLFPVSLLFVAVKIPTQFFKFFKPVARLPLAGARLVS